MEICPTCDGTAKGGTDEKLLRFLYENNHSTPFEMAGAIIEVQAPIFVFREWHRHRVPFSYNEMSARYAPLPDVNYVPTFNRVMTNANGTNKQAGTVAGAAKLTDIPAQQWREKLEDAYRAQEALYQEGLAIGVPKELARLVLPVGRYSRMRASSNLRGWMNFLTLRQAENAQWEIRQYANALHDILVPLFPRSMELFDGK
jgi:thymidylate synthase (FAD)